MEISLLSDRYLVRRLTENDIAKIYALCKNNPLYYHYCPPFVTYASIASDMKALPPNKDYSDKYYLGYYQGEKLIAVMDLILSYPDENTAFIGFFMTDISVQNAGIGSGIIDELCSYLNNIGFSSIRLGWVKGNPQAEHFWKKNLFTETGITYDTDGYTVVVAKRNI
jgi:RimJ/RimL family protein N-acetyltransferase